MVMSRLFQTTIISDILGPLDCAMECGNDGQNISMSTCGTPRHLFIASLIRCKAWSTINKPQRALFSLRKARIA